MGRERKDRNEDNQRRYFQPVTLMGLLLVGVLAMLGVAKFNRSVQPNRDMRSWVVDGGDVEIAAPQVTGVYTASDFMTLDGRGGSSAVTLPENVPTPTPTPAPTLAPETPEPTATPTPGPVRLTISAAGDCTLGGDTMGSADGFKRFDSYVTQYGYSYFLSNVRYIFEDDDLTIVNLEGPLSDDTSDPKAHGFRFLGRPEYVEILTSASVELCNVANNHAYDFGLAGLKRTAEVLTEAGIGFSGYSQAYYTDIKGVRVGSLGFTKWNYNAKQIAAAVAEARSQCDLLIVSIHWGQEGHSEADSNQRQLGRAAIDAGADLVIGTHPHVYGGIEQYNGKYIVYSLGNFCFGGNKNPSDKRCLIFQQSFDITPDGAVSDAGINIIPCTVSSVSNTNDFRPTVMTAKEGAALLKNIARYSKNFTLTDARWMDGNYLAYNGLVTLDGNVTAPTEAPQITEEPLRTETPEATAQPEVAATVAPTLRIPERDLPKWLKDA